jgi:hypothetical protein
MSNYEVFTRADKRIIRIEVDRDSALGAGLEMAVIWLNNTGEGLEKTALADDLMRLILDPPATSMTFLGAIFRMTDEHYLVDLEFSQPQGVWRLTAQIDLILSLYDSGRRV